MIRGLGLSVLSALIVALFTAQAFAASDVQDVALQRSDLAFLRSLYREPGMLDVSLKRYDRALILIGSVRSEASSARAEEIARESLDAAQLRNRLRVEPAQKGHDAPTPDAILQARIEKAIEEDADLRSDRRQLTIEVEQAGARIAGRVDGPMLARTLVDLVRIVPGLASLDFRQLDY
jgi:osmotically-inducible protein OsmY